MNKIDGLRISTALAYLNPARHRANLTVRPDTHVRRIVIEGGRATGIELETDGVSETLDTKGTKIVLCAGSIQSPSLLARSGVGPRDVLERLGVTVEVDAPGVGARLFDHPGTVVVLVANEGIASLEDPLIQTTLRYTATGSSDFNDMQLEPLSFLQRIGLTEGADAGEGPMFVGLAAVVEKTRGHGRLVFHSADPYAQPSIESNFLMDEWDQERMVEGLEIALRASETSQIREVAGPVVRPRDEVASDRDLLRRYACRSSGSGYHPCGTAPMGPDGDPLAVLDQYGRVSGVEGLFIADASIFPTIMRANTNIPTIMVGERFGEWFRDGVI
jgi:choline dehydrogenase